MKKKIKIGVAMGLEAITFTACSASVKGKAESFDVIKFSNEITALSHRGGETVSVVHAGMESVLNLVNPTQEEVAKYYYFTPEILPCAFKIGA